MQRQHRDRQQRSDRKGPSRHAIRDALDNVVGHKIPGTPMLSTARLLSEHFGTPFAVETRRVTDIRIQRGDPRHGAKRSDDHVSRYEVELPLGEVGADAFEGVRCPHCGGTDGLYRYHANHHIAGSQTLFCLDCEEVLYSEEWG